MLSLTEYLAWLTTTLEDRESGKIYRFGLHPRYWFTEPDPQELEHIFREAFPGYEVKLIIFKSDLKLPFSCSMDFKKL